MNQELFNSPARRAWQGYSVSTLLSSLTSHCCDDSSMPMEWSEHKRDVCSDVEPEEKAGSGSTSRNHVSFSKVLYLEG